MGIPLFPPGRAAGRIKRFSEEHRSVRQTVEDRVLGAAETMFRTGISDMQGKCRRTRTKRRLVKNRFPVVRSGVVWPCSFPGCAVSEAIFNTLFALLSCLATPYYRASACSRHRFRTGVNGIQGKCRRTRTKCRSVKNRLLLCVPGRLDFGRTVFKTMLQAKNVFFVVLLSVPEVGALLFSSPAAHDRGRCTNRTLDRSRTESPH